MYKKIILTILLLIQSNFVFSDPHCVMIPAYTSGPSAYVSGSGEYYDPYVYIGNTAKFKCVITGENIDKFYYKPQIHMDGRNCSLMYGWLLNETCTVSQINNVIFEFTPTMPGRFYLRVDYKEAGGDWKEINWSYWKRVILKFPPLDDELYFDPYSLPVGNHKPTATIVSLTDIGGNGTYSNPWRIHPDSATYKFRIDIADQDGTQDLIDGCYVWSWHFIPGGSMYNTTTGDYGKGVKTEAQTYIYYNDINGVVFPVDMNLARERDDNWTLCVQAIDRWGESSNFEDYNTALKYLISSSTPEDDPDPPPTPILAVLTDTLYFTATDTLKKYAVINMGGGTLTWQSNATIDWFLPNKGSGSLTAAQADTVTAKALRKEVAGEGFYSGNVSFTSNGGSKTMTAIFDYNIPPNPPTNLQVTEQ